MIYNYGSHYITKEDIELVKKNVENGTLTQGKLVGKFEREISKYFGSKYSKVFTNGSSALIALGKALGWSEKDLVITTPISFAATSNCALHLNAKVDFVDIDLENVNISCQKLEDKIKLLRKNRNKSRINVIAVDYAGLPCNWEDLRFLANKYSFKLINDNCHAMGSEYKGSKKYAIKYADAVTQSYHPVKNFTTGEGGAVLSNDIKIINKLSEIRDHGIKRIFKNKNHLWYYEMKDLGFNFRLNEISCALGISQINKLDNFIKKRRLIAKKYYEYLSNKNLILPKTFKDRVSSYHLFNLRYAFVNQKQKNHFFKDMLNKKIKLQVHYIPIYKHPYYKKLFKKFKLENAEKYYLETFSIPIHYKINDVDVAYISSQLNKILKNV